MKQTLPAESIYQQLGALLSAAPDLTAYDNDWNLPGETTRWLSRASALVHAAGASTMLEAAKLDSAIDAVVKTFQPEQNARIIIMVLNKVLARLEFELPAQSQGGFVTTGSDFDAIAMVGKVLSAATSDVLLIDPYLDQSALTDFAVLVPERVAVHLLTDSASMKPGLKPTVEKWASQYGATRPIAARATPPRTLHDRLIIIDQTDAWILTQSLKDFAKRSPASLQRTGAETAQMKVHAYAAIWAASTDLIA